MSTVTVTAPTEVISLRRRLRRLRKRVQRRVLGALATVSVPLLSRLPRSLARRLGRAIGGVAYFVAQGQRQVIEDNLQRAFGDEWSAARRRELAWRLFRHFGEGLLDNLVLARWGPEKIMQRVPIVGWERARHRVEEAQKQGRGCLVMTGHFGNWEMIGVLGCWQWPTAGTLARRYEVPAYQRLVERLRDGLGIRVFPTDGSLREPVRLLRENGVLGVLPDVDVKNVDGVFVDFFGSPAHTPATPASLAVRFGTPMVAVFALRHGDGFRIVSRPAIQSGGVESSDDPVRELTQVWCDLYEHEIRQQPHQWIWNHRRWHTTPEVLAMRRERQRSKLP